MLRGNINNLVILICCTVLVSGSAAGGNVKVFLLGGQSNATGSGHNEDYPALYQSGQSDVEFWVGGRFAGDGVPDYTWDRDASTSFGPLKQGTGNFHDGSTSGCELSLGRTLKDAMAGEKIAIVKYGMSGSAIERGLRNEGAGDWDSGQAPLNGSFEGIRYHVFKHSGVLPALKAITDRGDTYEIAGMFWMQGETDAGKQGAANNYQKNLLKLINSVRKDFDAPTMPFFIGRLKDGISRPYLPVVRNAMENAAKLDHHTYLVNTDDLAMNTDKLHYSALGQVEMGERFANTWLASKGMRGTEPIDEAEYAGTIRVACVGDSITYGAGIADRANDSYPAKLQAILGSGYDVRNFGRSGARVTQTSSNPYKGSSQYNEAIAFNPHVVIIALGINDCSVGQWDSNKLRFIGDYKDLIGDFRALGAEPKIWLCNLMPAVPPYEPYLGLDANIEQCDPMIEQVAIDKGLGLIDLFTNLNPEENVYSADGLHPSKEGAAIIAETVGPAIRGDYGGLKMSFAFGDHMVLQRNEPIPVFGTGNVGDTVTVGLGSNTATGIVDGNGRWRVDMGAMSAGGPYTLSVSDGVRTLVFTDVLAGEVWVAAGQSNMAWRCDQDADWTVQGPLANNYPNIRLLNRQGQAWPGGGEFSQETLNKITVDDYYVGNWQVCSQANAATISAVAYYFARDIHVETGVPVGIIENAIGGTSMEAYMTRASLSKTETYPVMKDWLNASIATDWHRGRAKDNLGLWLDGGQSGVMPHHPFEPTFLFDAEIADLIPMAIKGVLWYQGETNATDSSNQVAWDQEFTRSLLEGLIEGWRTEWGQGEFPFYYVQLPNLNRNWMLFREMQLQTLDNVSNTGMAVTIDLGNPSNVHPKAKQEVGRRLSLWARANEYGESGLVYSGPLYNGSFADEGDKIRVGFDHVGGGLKAKSGELAGFEVSDAYGKWYEATAVIDGDEVVVSSAKVAEPKAVRYAWAQNPVISLTNSEGLPASPFRAGNFTVNADPCVLFDDDFEDYDIENPTDFSVNDKASGNWAASNTDANASRMFSTKNFGGSKLWISLADGTSITSKGITITPNTRYAFSAVMVCETSKAGATGQVSFDLVVGETAAVGESVIGDPVVVTTHGDGWVTDDSKADHVFEQEFMIGGLNEGDKLFVVTKRISSSAWIGVDDVKVSFSRVGDINGDCDVNLLDFALLVINWLERGCVDVPPCGGADITGDNAVDVEDYAKLALGWL